MSQINRVVQRRILDNLREVYPEELDFMDEVQIHDGAGIAKNLHYLHEHGLINAQLHRFMDGGWSTVRAKLTARGIDFLADDGGLTAILGTVTVRFHEDSLKALIEAKVQAFDLPQPEKKRWLDSLRELPAESTKHLATKLIDAGLEYAPDALRLVQTFLAGHLH